MFTGLIEDIGTVKSVLSSRIVIETKIDGILRGDSIAVNGVCLTAVIVNENSFVADYSPNTDKITTLSKLKQNSKVNLERALKLSSRIGGHIVSGHIDGKAKIKKIEKLQEFYRIVFFCDEKLSNYCVEKASIAIDGISLTLSSFSNLCFEIFVIPETFNSTIIQFKKVDDEVNVEIDIVAKYIKRIINNKKTNNISLEILKKNGFI
jgi:riboflavin synthase